MPNSSATGSVLIVVEWVEPTKTRVGDTAGVSQRQDFESPSQAAAFLVDLAALFAADRVSDVRVTFHHQ